MAKYQRYNSRNKKWILFENGKIKKTSDNKFKGVSTKAKGGNRGRGKKSPGWFFGWFQ